MSKNKKPILSDDDHLDRPDISSKEFKESLLKLQDKFGTKKENTKSEFSDGVIDALNSIQQ